MEDRRSILINKLNENSTKAKNASDKDMKRIFEQNIMLENLLLNPPESDQESKSQTRPKIITVPGHLTVNNSLRKIYSTNFAYFIEGYTDFTPNLTQNPNPTSKTLKK